MAADSGVVNIHGKQYHTVAGRIATFRDEYSLTASIETDLVRADDEMVVVKATIRDAEGRVISTGYAEEVRGSSNINKTSALENAETSAVGRALAFFGLGGTEIASADEVANAIGQQKEMQAVERLVAHNRAWREHEASCASIREHCHAGNFSAAWEEWNEIPEDARMALRVAPTRGGWMDGVTKDGLAAGKDLDFKDGVYQSIANK